MSNPKSENLNIVYFGHNRTDTASVRRLQSFVDAGAEVTAFTFRRDNDMSVNSEPWTDIKLGDMEHMKHIRRIKTLLGSFYTIFKNRIYFVSADIVYARNIDIYLLAWFALLFKKSNNPKVVYEVLDVHDKLTGDSAISKILRTVERLILKHSDLLVVSSCGFIKNYFIPTQKYNGHYLLVENKLYFKNGHIDRLPPPPLDINTDKTLTIVWAGNLRCKVSLDLFKELAKTSTCKIEIRMHGVISFFLIPDFLEQIEPYPNITFHGAYTWPDGLKDIYEGADLVWSQELAWSSYNSDWLIPNRVYEASYFNIPSLCVKNTQTSKFVLDNSIGYALNDSRPVTLINFIDTLDPSEIYQKKLEMSLMPDRRFLATANDAADLLHAILKVQPNEKFA